MPVPVSVVAWQESIERRLQVVVGARAQLHDDQTGRRVGHEHGQQAVTLFGHEPGAGARQVGEAADPAGPDDEGDALSRSAPCHGNRVRNHSRALPREPPDGADS